ncbi:hypothetical protein L596_026592 [Steinernema carpocapsae]|uniref:Uncharacterized protein n=1 Tax=Steinernema carpocapsae TaxID=34508 RepID=A0A4U5M1V0_STECR|nr:hypothetical protein L596_026592 [Steinernema carpocapsae]
MRCNRSVVSYLYGHLCDFLYFCTPYLTTLLQILQSTYDSLTHCHVIVHLSYVLTFNKCVCTFKNSTYHSIPS